MVRRVRECLHHDSLGNRSSHPEFRDRRFRRGCERPRLVNAGGRRRGIRRGAVQHFLFFPSKEVEPVSLVPPFRSTMCGRIWGEVGDDEKRELCGKLSNKCVNIASSRRIAAANPSQIHRCLRSICLRTRLSQLSQVGGSPLEVRAVGAGELWMVSQGPPSPLSNTGLLHHVPEAPAARRASEFARDLV